MDKLFGHCGCHMELLPAVIKDCVYRGTIPNKLFNAHIWAIPTDKLKAINWC